MASLDAPEVFDAADLAGLTNRVWEGAMALATADPAGTDLLSAAIMEIQELELWVQQAHRLRPTIGLTDGLARTIEGFRDYLDAVLDALRAATIPEAQGTQIRLQAALDSITDRVAEIGTSAEALGTILNAQDPTGAALQLGALDDFATVEERGAALLSDRIGLKSGDGPALAAVVFDGLSTALGEPAAFWKMVSGHLSVLRTGGQKVIDAMSTASFAERLSEVAHDTLSAARRSARSPEALTDREGLTDLLEAGHLLVEQPIKLHLGLAMAGVTKRDFAATQLCDVSELANLASEHGWAVAPYLPPPAARNAFAHRRYAVEAGAAIFQGPKSDPVKTRTEPRELQDIILRTVEAALAMDLAAAIVADEAGIVLPSDLPVVWVVEALMGGLGWSEVRCSIADGGVNAEATLEEDGSLALLSLVAHPLLGFSEKLDLLLHGPTGSVRLTTSLPLLAAWSAMDDSVEKSARYVVVARSTYRDGQPLMTEAAAAKVLANWAFQSAIDEEVDSAATLGCLRAIRNVARELDLADLAKMLGTLVHWHLSRGTDTQVTIDELQDMLGVAALDVDPPSQMLLS